MKTMTQNNGEIGKEPDKTNPEDLPDYIWPFMSKLKAVNSNYFHLHFLFYLLLNLFLAILFLELGIKIRVTRSCQHIAGYVR